MIPKEYFNTDESGVLRLLTEQEWRGIGITQSLGWEHYEVHSESFHSRLFHVSVLKLLSAPEPHVLLFRRAINYVPPPQPRLKETRRK